MLTDIDEDLQKQEEITQRLKRYVWRETIEPLISDDLVAEHRRDPLGLHSVHLDMVLTFLRDDPVPSEPRLVIVIVEPETSWCIGEFSREPGTVVYCRPTLFFSVEQIEHAIFLERLELVRRAYAHC